MNMELPNPVPAVCAELQSLQRKRSVVLKSRNMMSNRLQALVAGTLGYRAGMQDAERKAVFKQATAVIDGVLGGTAEHEFAAIITVTAIGISAFNGEKRNLEKEMVRFAKRLPVAAWVEAPAQRGFGLLFLAEVVGEAGDLSGYANPAKLWRRLGCAPWTFNGKTRMGATWRSGKEGKLPASEWEAYGYSPRRRSIAYLIGEGIVKQNGPGPYRARYLEKKAQAFMTHPEWDWKKCAECKGTDKQKRPPCDTCGGTGRKCKRAHRHGMLLATKLLLKELWLEWHGRPEGGWRHSS